MLEPSNKIYPIKLNNLNVEESLFYPKDLEEEERQTKSSLWKQILSAIFASTIKQTLEEVRENYEDLCTRREVEMKGIVLRNRCTVPLMNMMWGLVGTVLGMIAVFIGFVLWPTENVFLHPDHWYECMLQCGIVWVGELHIKWAYLIIKIEGHPYQMVILVLFGQF